MSSTYSEREGSEWTLGGAVQSRDESAFYQAETQNLTRENQMLKLRIRELGEWVWGCGGLWLMRWKEGGVWRG